VQMAPMFLNQMISETSAFLPKKGGVAHGGGLRCMWTASPTHEEAMFLLRKRVFCRYEAQIKAYQET
jgi:hypothetical protein